MQHEIQLNIFPFKASVEESEFAFYTAKQDCFCLIHKDDLNGAIERLVEQNQPAVINQLIEQVYMFSRMYWNSVNHRNLPVTIKYPENRGRDIPILHPRQTTQSRQGEPVVFVNK